MTTPTAGVETPLAEDVLTPTPITTKKGERKTVLVLYVGGTLGMCHNEHGALAPKKGYLVEEMRRMSDLQLSGMPSFEIIEYDPLVDSSDVRPSDWVRMAQDIYNNYYKYDGFLIAHGTDTMHYTASALSFMLSNLGKPVIVTGAMIPLVEPYNDARRNLIISMMFATHPELCDVCIYFNQALLRGNRAIKKHVTVSAFESPSYPPLAILEGYSFSIAREALMDRPTGPLAVHSNMNANVLYFTVTPDFDFDAVEKYLQAADCNCQGIVLELCGVGAKNALLTEKLSKLSSPESDWGSKTMIAATSQTLGGGLPTKHSTRLSRYCPHLVMVGDMTAEAAVTKAMYLFGRGLSVPEVKRWMKINIRGELSQEVMHANL